MSERNAPRRFFSCTRFNDKPRSLSFAARTEWKLNWESVMAKANDPSKDQDKLSRERLAELLNDDLAREYQAIIAYVVYSQVLKGAEYMSIAGQLETHAQQELKHALTISRQIDYLGKMPCVTPKPVK